MVNVNAPAPATTTTATTNINDTDILSIVDVPVCASEGHNSGIITQLEVMKGTDNAGAPFKHLNVTVEVDTNTSSVAPITVVKVYNVHGQGRGPKLFCADVQKITNTKIAPRDLGQFRKSMLVGKRADFILKYRKDGKKEVPYISEFLSTAEVAPIAA